MHHRLLILLCFTSALLHVFKTVQSGVITKDGATHERLTTTGAPAKYGSADGYLEKSDESTEGSESNESAKWPYYHPHLRHHGHKHGKFGIFSGTFWAEKLSK